MKVLLFLSTLLVVVLATEDKYTTKYDNVDLDTVLNNERFLTRYYKCLMDQGYCTPDAKEIKKIIPDAIATGCSKCTDHQKEGSKKVFKFLQEKQPDMLKELKTKYDPEGKYSPV